MNDKTQELRLVRSQRDTLISLGVSVGSLVLLYYLTDSAAWERHTATVHNWWHDARHQVSIWQAIQAIRNLPETDTNDPQ